MIEFAKVQCTCAHGYTCRNMEDPNCCAHNCGYNELVDELNKIIAERDNALAQNAELVAELTLLSTFRDEVTEVMNDSQGVAGWHKNHQIATWDELFPVVPDFESPQQHLRNIQAEAGRAGFVAGACSVLPVYSTMEMADIEADARNHAERIRRGEK